MGWPGVANPKSLTFARLAPGEGATGAHQPFENLGVMRGVERDEAHPFPDAAEHPLDDVVLDLAVGGVAPPNENVGGVENAFR